ncbi:hypothetical protein ABK040_007612 [Willaertia magna]
MVNYFDRTKLIRPGKFEYHTLKQKTGIAISILGLLYGANLMFNDFVKPIYFKWAKPSTEAYLQFLKDEWNGKH